MFRPVIDRGPGWRSETSSSRGGVGYGVTDRMSKKNGVLETCRRRETDFRTTNGRSRFTEGELEVESPISEEVPSEETGTTQ